MTPLENPVKLFNEASLIAGHGKGSALMRFSNGV